MDEKKKTIEKWRDYFIYNVADDAHRKIESNKASAEELLAEITESDEY